MKNLIGRSGGAERIYCELANILSEKGHKVTCLFFDKGNGEIFYHIDNTVERINIYGAPKKSLKVIWKSRKYLPKKIANKLDWQIENDFFQKQLNDYFTLVKPDIAISFLPPANTPTLLAAKDTSVKVISTNHSVPEQDYNNPTRWSTNPYDRNLRLNALDYASAIHVLFPEFGEWFPPHLHKKIVTIPNYISPEIKKSNHPPVKEKVIVAAGRLAEVKNYIELIKSWQAIETNHPEWQVRIFGLGPQRGFLKEEIKKRGLQGRIHLPGHVADVADVYASASIFCHPALFEGFGLSPAEALYMGTPVVCYSDCLGVNQFVKNGYNGLTVSRAGERDELADGLNRLIEDAELRDALAANGPKSVEHFEIEKYKKTWFDLIEKLTGDN